MIAVVLKMGYKAGNINKLHPTTLEAKSIKTINSYAYFSSSLVLATIVTYGSGTNYGMHLENALLEAVNNKAFI